MEAKGCLILSGESGSSKTTVLNEIICDYYDKNYIILYNEGAGEIERSFKVSELIERLGKNGQNVLVAVDDAHDIRRCEIFNVISKILSNIQLRENIKFIVTVRLPDYELLIKYGLGRISDNIIRESLLRFYGDVEFERKLRGFNEAEVKGFIKKRLEQNTIPDSNFNSEEKINLFAKLVHEDTAGYPIMIIFSVLGSGLRKNVENVLFDLTYNDKENMQGKMVTAIICSLFSISNFEIDNEILVSLEIDQYAEMLKDIILFEKDGKLYTRHSRWSLEFLSALFTDEIKNGYNKYSKIKEKRNELYFTKALKDIFKLMEEKKLSILLQYCFIIWKSLSCQLILLIERSKIPSLII